MKAAETAPLACARFEAVRSRWQSLARGGANRAELSPSFINTSLETLLKKICSAVHCGARGVRSVTNAAWCGPRSASLTPWALRSRSPERCLVADVNRLGTLIYPISYAAIAIYCYGRQEAQEHLDSPRQLG